MDFSHHKSPNTSGTWRQVVRNQYRMENHTKCIFLQTLHFKVAQSWRSWKKCKMDLSEPVLNMGESQKYARKSGLLTVSLGERVWSLTLGQSDRLMAERTIRSSIVLHSNGFFNVHNTLSSNIRRSSYKYIIIIKRYLLLNNYVFTTQINKNLSR